MTTRHSLALALGLIIGLTAANFALQVFGPRDWKDAWDRSVWQALAIALYWVLEQFIRMWNAFQSRYRRKASATQEEEDYM